MKTFWSVLVFLALSSLAHAQTPASPPTPIRLAQAGGSSSGAGLPPVMTGAASGTVAVIALAVAGVAAATSYSSTASHH